MRPVVDSALPVGPALAQEGVDELIGVADVGQTEQRVAAGLEERYEPLERRPRVAQVLEDVAADDAIEALVREGRADLVPTFDVANDRAVEAALRLRGHRRIELDPDNPGARALRLQPGAERSGRAADIQQHTARRGQQCDEIAPRSGVRRIELRHRRMIASAAALPPSRGAGNPPPRR